MCANVTAAWRITLTATKHLQPGHAFSCTVVDTCSTRTFCILGDARVGAVEHNGVLSDNLQVVHHSGQLAVILAGQPGLHLRQRQRQRDPSVVEQPLCNAAQHWLWIKQ